MTGRGTAGGALEAEVERLTNHFDHHDPGLNVDTCFEVYGRLLEADGVPATEAHGGYRLLVHHNDVNDAELNPETFSVAGGVFNPRITTEPLLPLELEGEYHAAVRELYLDLLNIRNVQRFEPYIRAQVELLLSAFTAGGGGDFVVDVAARLPIDIAGEIIGFDHEFRARVKACADRSMAGIGSEVDPDASKDLHDLIHAQVVNRRAHPRDDKLTEVVNAKIDGRPLTEDELDAFLTAYVVAGYVTTAHALASVVFELARDRSLQDRVRQDPSLISTVVEEGLRMYPPVHSFFRTVTEEVEVRGTTLEPGTRTALMFGAANRDPEKFEDPGTFCPDRANARQHMSFGFGAHFCAGAHLARAEMRIALEVLFERYPSFELAGEPRWPSQMIVGHHLGLEYLPIRFAE